MVEFSVSGEADHVTGFSELISADVSSGQLVLQFDGYTLTADSITVNTGEEDNEVCLPAYPYLIDLKSI